ncbi:MAG: metallophosphoesterase [Firmicutes bacterium]|nr:metallophosphoesterase [Bacillota bacterium]
MKIFAISDLHLSINNPKPMDVFGGAWEDYLLRVEQSWCKKVTEDDVVLIAGDISWAMMLPAAVPDLEYLGKYPGKKIIIRGNHDYWWKSISAVRAVLPPNMFALQNDCLRLGDVLFCGSRGWSVDGETEEDKKIYERELIRMRLSLEEMTKKRGEGDRAVALIHYPPFNCRPEKSRMTELFSEFKVDKVVYGHLHGRNVRSMPCVVMDGVEYYITSCDQVGNKLVEVL